MDCGARPARTLGFDWTAILGLLAYALVTQILAGAPELSAAPSGGTLRVDRHTIDGGGTSIGAAFEISGTIAQPDVDPLQPSTGGPFAITGGFWFTVAPSAEAIFSNGFETQ